ncbi:amidohydrolase [bacterium]|nr:amidohydrolase [bacterium]
MSSLRIDNVDIWTGVERGILHQGALEACDGAIRFVGAASDLPPADEGCERLDGRGMLLMPGFVNAHTHLAMTLLRGYADDMPLKPWLEEKIWPIEMKLKPEDVYWGSALGVVEMIRAGVTCFNDMYHYPEQGAQAALDLGMRALPSGVLLGFIGDVKGSLERAIEFTLEWQTRGRGLVTAMLGPHAPYTCPDDLLTSVAAAAQEHGLGIHIHLSETEHEVQESIAAHGVSPVRHLDDLGVLNGHVTAAHCVHLSDEDIALLAERQVGVAHCPGSNMKLSSGFARVPELLEAGATVGLGTDGAASNNNLDLLEEARLAALIHKGYSGDPTVVNADQALRMATAGGAAALGLADRIGTLEVGKRADCILMDLSGAHTQPLFDVESQIVYAAHSRDVDSVVIDGCVKLRHGELVGMDEAEIIARATACAHRLMG